MRGNKLQFGTGNKVKWGVWGEDGCHDVMRCQAQVSLFDNLVRRT